MSTWGDAGYVCVSILVVHTIKGAKKLLVLFLFSATLDEKEPSERKSVLRIRNLDL